MTGGYHCTHVHPRKWTAGTWKLYALWKGKSSSLHLHFWGSKCGFFGGVHSTPKFCLLDLIWLFNGLILNSRKIRKTDGDLQQEDENVFLPQHGFSQHPNSPTAQIYPTPQQPRSPDLVSTPQLATAQVFPDSALPAEQPGGGFCHGKKRLGCFVYNGGIIHYLYIYIYTHNCWKLLL